MTPDEKIMLQIEKDKALVLIILGIVMIVNVIFWLVVSIEMAKTFW